MAFTSLAPVTHEVRHPGPRELNLAIRWTPAAGPPRKAASRAFSSGLSFPGGSRIDIPKDAEIEFTFLADRNYSMRVAQGEVTYTDGEGNVLVLTGTSPMIIVPGATSLPIPVWRLNEPNEPEEHQAATP